MGCSNTSITNCQGPRPWPSPPACSDTEFMARSLAFGGAINLKPDDSAAEYAAYKVGAVTYNLQHTGDVPGEHGFIDWMRDVGFRMIADRSEISEMTPGAVLVFQDYKAPAMSLGGGVCSAHTPVVHGGPHCSIGCEQLAPTSALFKGIYTCEADCFDKHKAKADCDADKACAWCTSGAVPPACNTIEDAKSLPPSVFTCDKVL